MGFTGFFKIGRTVNRIIGILVKFSGALTGLSNNQKALAERYTELNASHELLRIRYDEVVLQLAQQQATNAELYSNIILIAQAIKSKGIDVTFPQMEFETKPTKDPGVN